MNRSRRRALLGILFAGAVAAGEAPAADGRLSEFSREELLSLPRVCHAQRFISQDLRPPVVPEPERQQMEEKLGHSFIHYHHYCWGLLYERRAEQPGGDKFNFRRAINNLNYVTRHADPGFALLPEVYFKKGKVYERIGERQAAIAEYQSSLRASPGFTPASTALVQSYLDLGDLAAARAALEAGLKHDPDSRTLAAQKSVLAEREKQRR